MRRRSATLARMMRSCSARSAVASDAQARSRPSGTLARLHRDRHAREIVDRAARPDAHPRRAADDVGHERLEHRADVLFEPLAFGLRRRVVADELGGEPADAERHALGPAQPGRVADHELDAAAADVDAERRRRVDHDARAHRREDEASLLEAADDLDLDAGLVLDPVDELAAVRGGAHRARRLGEHFRRAERVGELLQPAHGRDGAIGRRGRDAAVARDVVTEAQHLLLAGDGLEGAVGVHVGDEEVERVRAEVERCDAHVTVEDIGLACAR